MKKFIFTTVLSLSMVFAFGQTKKIAHESHSGSASNLSFSSNDNFGLVDPEKLKKKKDTTKIKTDTLKMKADTLKMKTDTLKRRHDSLPPRNAKIRSKKNSRS